MLKPDIIKIIEQGVKRKWVPEPEAKRLLALEGLDVPRYVWARTYEEARQFAEQADFPLAAKVVSSRILHKSDVGGVIVGIDSADKLAKAWQTLSALDGFEGLLVEEMIEKGLELIIGAKIDYQFGPVILLGLGGTGVEIYHDVTMRMAPLAKPDGPSMIDSLKGKNLLLGFRGQAPVNIEALSDLLVRFSLLITDLADSIQSIDLNPVICSGDRCVIADARIILND